MGLRPAVSIDDELSAQINEIVRPSPFSHPKSFVALQLLGASDGTVVKSSLDSAASGRNVVALQADDLSASDVLASVLPLASVNHGVKFNFISNEHLKASPAAVEGMMEAFAKSIGATYTPGTGPLSGKLQLGENAVLDCTVPEDQAFVAELVYKFAELEHSMSQTQVQQVLQLTFTSLHALSVKYGADSPKVAAATSAVVKATASALPADAFLQVTAVTVDAADAPTIRQQLQRTLKAGDVALQAANNAAAAARSKKFSTKAIAYGALMILLYFSFAGIYCMCSMKFKRDSLLYGKSD